MFDASSYGFKIVARAPQAEQQLLDPHNLDQVLMLAKHAGFNVKTYDNWEVDEGSLIPVSGRIGLYIDERQDIITFRPSVQSSVGVVSTVCQAAIMKSDATFTNVTKLLVEALQVAKDYDSFTRGNDSIVLGRGAVFRRTSHSAHFVLRTDDMIVSIHPNHLLYEMFVDFHHNGGRGSTIEMASSAKPHDKKTAYKPDVAKALLIECFNDIDTERIALRTGGYYSHAINAFEKLRKSIS